MTTTEIVLMFISGWLLLGLVATLLIVAGLVRCMFIIWQKRKWTVGEAIATFWECERDDLKTYLILIVLGPLTFFGVKKAFPPKDKIA
jgi:uncharacterized membrane protein